MTCSPCNRGGSPRFRLIGLGRGRPHRQAPGRAGDPPRRLRTRGRDDGGTSDAELQPIEQEVHLIFNRLRTLRESTRTLSFYISYNGWLFGEHRVAGSSGRTSRPPGAVCDALGGHTLPRTTDRRLVANVDIAATIYDATEITPRHRDRRVLAARSSGPRLPLPRSDRDARRDAGLEAIRTPNRYYGAGPHGFVEDYNLEPQPFAASASERPGPGDRPRDRAARICSDRPVRRAEPRPELSQRARQDSNLRPPAPEARALSTELRALGGQLSRARSVTYTNVCSVRQATTVGSMRERERGELWARQPSSTRSFSAAFRCLQPFGEGQPYDLVVHVERRVPASSVQDGLARRRAASLFNAYATDHGRGQVSYVGRADVFGVYFPPTRRDLSRPGRASLRTECRLRSSPLATTSGAAFGSAARLRDRAVDGGR